MKKLITTLQIISGMTILAMVAIALVSLAA